MFIVASQEQVRSVLSDVLWRPCAGQEHCVEGIVPLQGNLPYAEGYGEVRDVARAVNGVIQDTSYGSVWFCVERAALETLFPEVYVAQTLDDYALGIAQTLAWKPYAYEGMEAWRFARISMPYEPVAQEIANRLGSAMMAQRRSRRDYDLMMNDNAGEACRLIPGRYDNVPVLQALATGLQELGLEPAPARSRG